MPLTNSQINTLRTFVQGSANAAIIAARAAGATVDLAALLNATAAPEVKSWGPEVPASVIDAAANYNGYDALVQGKRDAWSVFLLYAPRDMGKNKNRNLVTDVWGDATASSKAESILLACLESASLAESTIGGNTRTTGTVSGLSRNFVGRVTQDEAQRILRSV